jgi:hemolysin III
MSIQRQDKFSTYSHLGGAIAAAVGTLALIFVARHSLSLIIISAIYGFSAVFMLLSSTLYHAHKTGENQTNFLRKMDHIAIFFMIAGTFTPLCFIYLEGAMKWGIIGAQWALVVAGFFLKVFYIKAPRRLTTIIYLLMGWMAIIPLKQFLSTMPLTSLILLLLGGIAYSVGAVFYIRKWPNPRPGVFGFHEIFHILILIGVFLHYPMVLRAIISN